MDALRLHALSNCNLFVVLRHQHLWVPALGKFLRQLKSNVHVWILQIHSASARDRFHVHLFILLLPSNDSA